MDGLILVCAGAGGHAGTLSPFALVREVRQWFSGTILLSGAIADGWSVASALRSAPTSPTSARALSRPRNARRDRLQGRLASHHSAADVVYTNLFTGIHGNYLAPSIAAAGLDPENLPVADKSAR